MTRDAGIDAAGNRAGDAIGRLRGPGRWLGRVAAAVVSLVGAVVASLSGLVTRNVPAAVGGAVILVLGKVVALGQTVAGLERGRRLTAEEAALLNDVYRDSVDLSAIRLVPGRAGVFGASSRPFTLGATIYLKKDALRDDVLVHECAHVWQYQHFGPRYAFDAVWAQWRRGKAAYDWVGELGRGRAHWREFNREAQAEFLQDIARHQRDFFSTGVRCELHGVDHTDLATATLDQVRAGRLR